jgi:hypothetical protein
VSFVFVVLLCAKGAEGAGRQGRRLVVSSLRSSAKRNRVERQEA